MPNLLDCRTHLNDELYDELTPAMKDELNQILASIKVPIGPTQQELDALIAEGDGLTDPESTAEFALEWHMHMYRHNLWSICLQFTNPIYRERAQRNPRYWDNATVGGVHIPSVKTPVPPWMKGNKVAEGILIRNARLVDEMKARDDCFKIIKKN